MEFEPLTAELSYTTAQYYSTTKVVVGGQNLIFLPKANEKLSSVAFILYVDFR